MLLGLDAFTEGWDSYLQKSHKKKRVGFRFYTKCLTSANKLNNHSKEGASWGFSLFGSYNSFSRVAKSISVSIGTKPNVFLLPNLSTLAWSTSYPSCDCFTFQLQKLLCGPVWFPFSQMLPLLPPAAALLWVSQVRIFCLLLAAVANHFLPFFYCFVSEIRFYNICCIYRGWSLPAQKPLSRLWDVCDNEV